MRKVLGGIFLILVALPAFPAVEYDFTQRTHSDIDQIRPTNLSGHAVIDGDRSRVDFLTGDLYPPNTYCISTNGSRTLKFVDPVMKSYTEVNSVALAAAIGQTNITVANLKSDLQKLDDHPRIAGTGTEHYRLTITFDMTVQIRTMPLRQSVKTEIDKWTAIEFGDIADTSLNASTIRTGNQQLDDVIDLEATKIKGFPLKQTVKITTTNLQGVAPNSKLAFNPVRTQTREMMVTSIKRMPTVDPSAFLLPASYRRNDTQALAEKAAQTRVTVLSFEEGTTQ